MISHSKPHITAEDLDATELHLRTGMLAQGKLVATIESQIADFHGAQGGVAVSSGTAALVLALRALNLAPGSEVILPTYVCSSVAEAIVAADCTPVLCDVGSCWNMDAETIESLVTPLTKAIVLVHIFGIAADARSVARLGIPIIEDCCQALGARSRSGDLAGSVGIISFFSFHATKCLATGEGGMAISRDARLVAEMRRLRDGAGGQFGLRVASPMSDLQAALGLSQWKRYGTFIQVRRDLASRYFDTLPRSLTTKVMHVSDHSMFFRFPLFSERLDMDAAIIWFGERGIMVRRGVDELLHRRVGLPDTQFPSAISHFEGTLSIPIYPALQNIEQSAIIEAVRDWHAQH